MIHNGAGGAPRGWSRKLFEAAKVPLMLLLSQAVDATEVLLQVAEDQLLVRELDEEAYVGAAPFLQQHVRARLTEDMLHDVELEC